MGHRPWHGRATGGRTYFTTRLLRAIICDSLDELGDTVGCTAQALMQAFDEKVNQFFVKSLQLDAFTMQLEHQ